MEVAEFKGDLEKLNPKGTGSVMVKEEVSCEEESSSRKVRDEGNKHIEETKDSKQTAESMRAVEQSVKQTTEGNTIRKVSSTRVSSSSTVTSSSQKTQSVTEKITDKAIKE